MVEWVGVNWWVDGCRSGTEFYFFWLYLKTHNKSCLTLTLSTCHFLKFLSVTAMNWAYEPNEPQDSLEEHIYSAYELWPTNWRSWDLRLFCIFKEICPYYEDTKELLTRTNLWGPFERTSNSGKIIIWCLTHVLCSLFWWIQYGYLSLQSFMH